MASILSKAFRKRGIGRRRINKMSKQGASIFKKKKRKERSVWWRVRPGGGGGRARGQTEKSRIRRFEKWCWKVGIELHPNLVIGSEGVCDGVGVVARESISKGECVALIPRTALLSCANSNIRHLVQEDETLLEDSTCSWVPLLLSLAAEHSYQESSKWHPYLSLVPTHMNLPMLWEESVCEHLLEGTGVADWVNSDLERIHRDFECMVKPFAEKHPELFKVSLASCDEYKKLVAFVMSYSFTDESAEVLGRTMMVPFVDLLNHSSRHHVELTFHPNHLTLVAVRDIEKGEEVMNTYGQLSNAALLHKYGFTERDNPHDEAVVSSETIHLVYQQHHSDSKRWDRLVAQDMVEEEYTIDSEGQPEECMLVLTSLLCSEAKRAKLQQPTHLQAMSSKEKLFLKEVAECCLECYPEQLTASSAPSCFSEQVLHPPAFKTSPSERHSYQVVLGQQKSLRKLLLNLE